MAESIVGRFQEYKGGYNLIEFVERLEAYFDANEINNQGKRRNILITVCSAKIYSTMKDMLSPDKPNSKTYNNWQN